MRTIALLTLVAAAPVSAQIQNPYFDTGFPPWVITPTANGGTIASDIAPYDIDGPGTLSTTNAARFMVGRLSPGTTPEGISLSQTISMRAGVDYRFSFNWSAHALVNVYNQTSGIFELLIDGIVIGSASAPVLAPNTRAYGLVTATHQATQTGPHTFEIRITRPVLRGEEVFQYVDVVRGACYPDCDGLGQLTGNDFQCFLSAFLGELPYANCDGSTVAPVLTPNDFQCYLNKYVMGCWGP